MCVCVCPLKMCVSTALYKCVRLFRGQNLHVFGETCASAASVAAHISTCQEHVCVCQATASVSDCNSRWLNHRDLPECGSSVCTSVCVCMCVCSLHTRYTQESRTRRHLRGRDQRFFSPAPLSNMSVFKGTCCSRSGFSNHQVHTQS